MLLVGGGRAPLQMVELLQWSEEQMLTARTGCYEKSNRCLDSGSIWGVERIGGFVMKDRELLRFSRITVIILNSFDLCFWERLSFL